jgi:hypothetical protein
LNHLEKKDTLDHQPLKIQALVLKIFLDTIGKTGLFSMTVVFSFRQLSPVLERNPLAAHAKRWLNGSTAVMRAISRKPFARSWRPTQKQSLRGFSLTHSGGVPILNASLLVFHRGIPEVNEKVRQ